ncbi:MAG TPA: valine--tRNA ligase [Candidatus Saccharimonadales bacterium]|jgi:valyl-tRNA synthetase|nr:valine--tRNA ligase [Candidatus Saccharimonadales bacterium]
MNLAKTYDPNQYEPTIYAMWETANAFAPTGKGEPYSIVMPPPNANGNLHIGHALMADLEDILARYYRMKGRDVAYIPGADHAGFETWVVYERELSKKGQSRFDFTREQLYSQVWNFVESQRGNMELQLRALGTSASWDDLVFTLDSKVINTVYGTFKKLWDEKLIYRGERIVSYCTTHQTSFADIEVEHKNEKGKLWKIAYPTLDKIGEIIIATTRPETLLGDVAIAVHPEDPRYKDLIGSRVLLPIVEREIPIIGDEYADPAFGTGAVKITPAHDPNDFEVGQRHNLIPVQVIDFNGTMINVPPQFMGLDVETARKRVLAALEAAELRRGEEDIEHAVGHCYKCGTVIQPLIKNQWFLSVKPLVETAKAAIEEGKITFYPESKKKTLIQYYDKLRDWNLSRQIPWGIPIPAFQNVNDPSDWIYDERVDEPTIVVNGTTYAREEDTFDTWFSSGQWPFITTDVLTGGELSRFYPTSVLETGHDILYPWVSRMIMLGLYVTGDVPFKEVYLHGLVLDEKGQKMSKSKGNVINPIEMVSEYGSDALRLGLVASRSAGQDQAFSTSKVIAGRNFANKLWNIARFIEDKLGEGYRVQPPQPTSLADHWIIRELNATVTDIDAQLKDYRFAEAGEAVYHAIWDNVADWFIEASKSENNPSMLAWVLDTSLKLAHPFAPFVTETIWQSLEWHNDLLISSSWPEAVAYDDIAAGEFDRLQKLVVEARYVTAELPGNERYGMLYQNDTLIAENKDLIKHLARLKEVSEVDQPRGLRLAASNREAWLDITQETMYEHQSNLEVRLAETRQFIATLEARLSNEAYLAKAPEALVEESRAQLESKKALVTRLQDELNILS